MSGIGETGEAILAGLRDGPKSWQQLADALGCDSRYDWDLVSTARIMEERLGLITVASTADGEGLLQLR